MLEIDNLNLSYGDHHVLKGVNAFVDEGEVVSLLGSNGAGKSSLIKTIIGLNRPDTGTIRFKGHLISGAPTHQIVELGIICVPEGRQLFPQMTVQENLEMGAYSKRARDGHEGRLEEIFEIYPVLFEKRNELTRNLSGGQQQMVAISRGLMGDPTLLILDEPTFGLAPLLVLEVFDIIKKISAEGISILLVEQNARQSLEISDRAYILENGEVSLEGSGEELLENDHVRKSYLGL
jgi:branched-chain amino acid transport system ATP-binding protein